MGIFTQIWATIQPYLVRGDSKVGKNHKKTKKIKKLYYGIGLASSLLIQDNATAVMFYRGRAYEC